MLKLKVPDMTCGHCAIVVSQAVHSVDTNAKIDIAFMSGMASTLLTCSFMGWARAGGILP